MLTPILLLVLLHILNAVYRSFTEANWRSVSGVIEESSIQHDDDSVYVLLRYQFLIDDQPYWGNQTIWSRNEKTAIETLADLAVGKKIKIEYHPNDPETQSRLFEPDPKNPA